MKPSSVCRTGVSVSFMPTVRNLLLHDGTDDSRPEAFAQENCLPESSVQCGFSPGEASEVTSRGESRPDESPGIEVRTTTASSWAGLVIGSRPLRTAAVDLIIGDA